MAETPLVLVGREGRRRVVTGADKAAHVAGLRTGMTASKAQALLPGLVVQEAEPGADAEALERLALWALRYSPVVAADPPDGLVIDILGAAHLQGGETALAAEIVTRLGVAGFSARVGIGNSWGEAHALARFVATPVAIAPTADVMVAIDRPAILNLPLAALRLGSDALDRLRVLGFRTVGELENTARAPLALRFGPELGRRLDQAMGRMPEPIDPARPPELIEARRTFGEPIGAAETIARYVGKLVVLLCAGLETRGLGVRRADLLLYRVDNRIEAIRIGTAQPLRDVKRLTRLLTDKIETIDPGFGIELMTLTATLTEPFEQRQAVSSLAASVEPDVSDLIDLLTNRVGESALYRFAPVASDVPERSVTRIAPAAAATGAGWPDHWPRPSRLLASPEAVETVALLPDHPPVSFTWRGIRRRVRRADGPERVFGEWWKRDAETIAVRDYFQVEDEDGQRFWLYRAGDGEDLATGSQRWFLHGIFG